MWSYTVSHYHLFFCIVLVALQFPEGLLMFACTIADILERYIVWLTSIILPPILDTLFKLLTPKKGEYFTAVAGWRFTSISETVKNPRSSQISLLDSLRTFRESTMNEVSILDYSFTFVSVTQQVLFLCESRINFLHFWTVTPSFALISLIRKSFFIKFVLILVALISNTLISWSVNFL